MNISLTQQHQLSAEQDYFKGDKPDRLSGQRLPDIAPHDNGGAHAQQGANGGKIFNNFFHGFNSRTNFMFYFCSYVNEFSNRKKQLIN
tara:strand:+ start:3249 stop:3512 length:264 start_codon:yes stop_codon:yes gene_type:complete